MRGSLVWMTKRIVTHGIIPAGAGLTSERLDELAAGGDHPRGCGAHGLMTLNQIADMGSSPRVRGSLDVGDVDVFHDGIIPAGAGLTLKNPNICAIPYFSEAQNHSLLNILTGYSL